MFSSSAKTTRVASAKSIGTSEYFSIRDLQRRSDMSVEGMRITPALKMKSMQALVPPAILKEGAKLQ